MTQLGNTLTSTIAMNPSSPAFLRTTLVLDAMASGATALLVLLAAGILSDLFAVPATLLQSAGLILLPYVAFVGYLGTRETAPRGAVWLVIVGNALWAVASLLLLVSGWIAPTILGAAFIAAQALIVGTFGGLQYVALRKQAI